MQRSPKKALWRLGAAQEGLGDLNTQAERHHALGAAPPTEKAALIPTLGSITGQLGKSQGKVLSYSFKNRNEVIN